MHFGIIMPCNLEVEKASFDLLQFKLSSGPEGIKKDVSLPIASDVT